MVGPPLELLILLHHVCSHQQLVCSYMLLSLCVVNVLSSLESQLQTIYGYCAVGYTNMLCLRQSVLGAEGLSLAFRHIVSSLLWYCSQHSSEELLHEVIICVGYFTVNHPDNQVIQLQTAQKTNCLSNLFSLSS